MVKMAYLTIVIINGKFCKKMQHWHKANAVKIASKTPKDSVINKFRIFDGRGEFIRPGRLKSPLHSLHKSGSYFWPNPKNSLRKPFASFGGQKT
jgi:hypothetical protein